MNIDFSILWIDDRKDFVDGLQPRLGRWLGEHGFRLKVLWHPSEKGVYEDLKNKDVDLIIVDYKLKGTSTGDTIISSIRDKGYWESIFFYSTSDNPRSLFPDPPDGVFFSDKNFALDRLKDVIGVHIKRSSNLATIRGWFVADAIDLEGQIDSLIARYFEAHAELSIARGINALKEDGSFFFGRIKGLLEKIFANHIEEMACSDHSIFDFGGKHGLLSGMVKDHIKILSIDRKAAEKAANLKTCKTILDAFPKEIIATRNALAHQKAVIAESGTKKVKARIKDAGDIEPTPEQCATMRNWIQKHHDNFNVLRELV